MAGRGPPPKPSHLRQRANKKSTAAVLRAPASRKRRSLPKVDGREWHRETRAWWRRLWSSPMATQFLESDVDPLFRLALLVDDFWKADTPSLRKELSVEIRLQEGRFGLTPTDRARMHWEVKPLEDEEDKPGRPLPRRPDDGADPRAMLRRVK